jgi:hypothetical protein
MPVEAGGRDISTGTRGGDIAGAIIFRVGACGSGNCSKMTDIDFDGKSSLEGVKNCIYRGRAGP